VAREGWDLAICSRDKRLTVEEADRRANASIPLGRICTLEEVGDPAAFLASDRAHFINGTMVNIDGGQRKAIMD
jgi:NAD(P)-dependent dehydrogenase (short-subunit alcohol dehydrogenase family)